MEIRFINKSPFSPYFLSCNFSYTSELYVHSQIVLVGQDDSFMLSHDNTQILQIINFLGVQFSAAPYYFLLLTFVLGTLCTHTHTHMHTHTWTHTHTHTCTRARAHMHKHTHTHTCTRARARTHTHTRTHTLSIFSFWNYRQNFKRMVMSANHEAPCYAIRLHLTDSQWARIAVGIATRYGLDGPGIESRWGRDFPHPSRPALKPTQPPVQSVPRLSRG